MATRNSKGQHQGTGQKQKASGQQTGGKRGGTEDNKDSREHYRSTEEKRQKGNKGGNR